MKMRTPSTKALCLLGAALACQQLAANTPCGASTPFETIEAESPSNKCSGSKVVMGVPPRSDEPSPEREASGYGYVELAKGGDFLEIKAPKAVNAIVVRHCIPDAPKGGGIEATLGLYVNGKRVQSLQLSSKYNWLYGSKEPGGNGQSNLPDKYAHVFWDETRFLIEGGVKEGDALRFQKDAQDSAAFYRIDLVDLEMAPEPLPKPENSISAAEFGAKGENADADTFALENCIDAAKASGKSVWLPAGTFLLKRGLKVDGVKIQGAGVWHTKILFTELPEKWTGIFSLAGEGPSVSNLFIESRVDKRGYSLHAFNGAARNWSVDNVWITHTNTAFWIGGSDGRVTNCRVRFTYADGININNGKRGAVSRILVENNHVRGTGDDGIAILSQIHKDDKLSTDEVTVRHNTSVAPWWASCCDMAGGNGHLIEDNYFEGNGLVVNLPGSYPMLPQGPSTIRRNVLNRCGGDFADQRRGALWIYAGSTTINGLVVEENKFVKPLFAGIDIEGSCEQSAVFRKNIFDAPPEAAVKVGRDSKGTGRFEENTMIGADPLLLWLANRSKGAYKVIESRNSWQEGQRAATPGN